MSRAIPIPILATLLSFLLGSCDGVAGPQYGQLRVSLATSGGDLDLDDYYIVVDQTAPRLVGINGTQEIGVLSVGVHVVTLEGVAENCDVDDLRRRSVTIAPEATVELAFAVTCYATGFEVTTTTAGLDIGRSYDLRIGGELPEAIPANGTFFKGRLTPGTYSVALSGLTSNCSPLVQPPVALEVRQRQVTQVTLSLSCVAISGVVEVTVATVGPDPDPSGYLVKVGAVFSRQVSANSVADFTQLPGGNLLVTLDGVASNCGVQGPLSIPLQVQIGGLTRDTARVRFDVLCVRVEKLAFVQANIISVAYADGSNAVEIASGLAPDWSADGSLIAFEARTCPSLANYSFPPDPKPCTELGLAQVLPDGTMRRTLTTFASDRNPAWSPDGQFVAFDRDGQLHLLRVMDGVSTRIVTPIPASQPTWAPDGIRIAFTCVTLLGNLDLCSINRDGTGFQRLTTVSASDTEPAWSPDGTQIAFTTTFFTGREDIALLNVATGAFVRVAAGTSPAWSGDGTRLAVVILGLGLAIVKPDGSGFQLFRRQGEYAPAWRR